MNDQFNNNCTYRYQNWWKDVAGHLGGIYPFLDDGDASVASLDVGTIIELKRARGESVKLDPVGLVTKATLPYLLGDRTLLEGVRRAPWMAQPAEDSTWKPVDLPAHGLERPDPGQFTQEFKAALLDEAREYVGAARSVGILLSGGMDSRVVAGVVRALQEESDKAFTVVGLTWGSESSRDVVYARRIVERFGWDWQHFPITADTLEENIIHAAHLGAEVSSLHLHAMPQVAKLDSVDVILAGSYGDSVGRAEFSGKRVTELKSILPPRLDRFAVIRTNALRQALPRLAEDVIDTPCLQETGNILRRREIEQEMHYMRRMLQTCMLSIASRKCFYQLFTAPNVFGLMWKLDPSIRGDEWYRRLLPLLPGNLLDIPWARTGRRFDQSAGPSDGLDKEYHQYGHWLRSELRDNILSRVNSDRIRSLDIFNPSGLDRAFRAWGRAGTASTNSLDEMVAWLASLHDFMEIHDIEGTHQSTSPHILDSGRSLVGGTHAHLYIQARERLRG